MQCILLLSLFALSSAALSFYQTEKYAIYQEHDEVIVSEFFQRLSIDSGIEIIALPRDKNFIKAYELIDKINEELHQAYLNYFNISKKEFPLPYIIISVTPISANFGHLEDDKIKSSNLISLGLSHLKSLESIYNTLAHEMAHYYHAHTGQQVSYFNAGYSENREDLNIGNEFGTHFQENKMVKLYLDQINMANQIYEGGRGTNASLTKIRLSPSDPLFLTIKFSYPNLFSKMTTSSCLLLQQKLVDFLNADEISLEEIQSIAPLEKNCEMTNQKSWDYIAKQFLPPTTLSLLEKYPHNYQRHNDPTIALNAKAILTEELPITTSLKIVYQLRSNLKEMIEIIKWDKLQFYTPESEADITSFKILNELNKAQYQLSFIELEPAKAASCIAAINDPNTEIPYLSEHRAFDIHGATCFRVYRAKRMLEALTLKPGEQIDLIEISAKYKVAEQTEVM